MIALQVTLEKKTRSKVTTPHSAHFPPSLDQIWQNRKLHRFQAKSKTCTAKLQRILQNWRECRAPWVKWTLIETKFFSHRYFPGAWTAVFSFDWRASGRDAPHHTFGLKTLNKILVGKVTWAKLRKKSCSALRSGRPGKDCSGPCSSTHSMYALQHIGPFLLSICQLCQELLVFNDVFMIWCVTCMLVWCHHYLLYSPPIKRSMIY